MLMTLMTMTMMTLTMTMLGRCNTASNQIVNSGKPNILSMAFCPVSGFLSQHHNNHHNDDDHNQHDDDVDLITSSSSHLSL